MHKHFSTLLESVKNNTLRKVKTDLMKLRLFFSRDIIFRFKTENTENFENDALFYDEFNHFTKSLPDFTYAILTDCGSKSIEFAIMM